MAPNTRDHKDGRKGEEAPSTRPSSSPALTRLQSHVATFMDEGTSSTIAATSVSNKMEEAEREIAAARNGRKMPLDELFSVPRSSSWLSGNDCSREWTKDITE
ncbi:unnamed protein product [Sphagnum troendelagicum]